LAFREYEKEFQELLNMLRNSNSKYKDTSEDKMYWAYSFSFFRKKGENTPEYYEALYKMPFEERLEVEMKRVRVNIALTAGYFYISDRVVNVSESIAKTIRAITMQKMANEQEFNAGDESILNSIPFVKDEEKLKPMSLQEQLKHAVEIEDYEDAARIRDEMKNLHERC
jgi:hypothetical protein